MRGCKDSSIGGGRRCQKCKLAEIEAKPGGFMKQIVDEACREPVANGQDPENDNSDVNVFKSTFPKTRTAPVRNQNWLDESEFQGSSFTLPLRKTSLRSLIRKYLGPKKRDNERDKNEEGPKRDSCEIQTFSEEEKACIKRDKPKGVAESTKMRSEKKGKTEPEVEYVRPSTPPKLSEFSETLRTDLEGCIDRDKPKGVFESTKISMEKRGKKEPEVEYRRPSTPPKLLQFAETLRTNLEEFINRDKPKGVSESTKMRREKRETKEPEIEYTRPSTPPKLSEFAETLGINLEDDKLAVEETKRSVYRLGNDEYLYRIGAGPRKSEYPKANHKTKEELSISPILPSEQSYTYYEKEWKRGFEELKKEHYPISQLNTQPNPPNFEDTNNLKEPRKGMKSKAEKSGLAVVFRDFKYS